jgi:flavin reductase (DIM6/NTAB) family NADH-FMN oxidoreductase RutF
MKSDFRKISPYEIGDNVFQLIDKEWMLITAGNQDHFNTMTASWGHLGVIWNLPVAICYIRPVRHTFRFANESDFYTLSFFSEEYRDILRFCGTKSGRDYDKVKETGLLPLLTDQGNVFFDQARMVMEVKKIYVDDLKEENFLLPEVARKNYPRKDYHRFYMGQIMQVLIRS